jgi:arylsulfatase I/J
VLVDDWGWAKVGYHRNPAICEVDTPNIDRLAKEEGIEINNFYAHTVCGPSRASLLSGRFLIHVSVDNGDVTMNDVSNADGDGYAGIPPMMTSIARKLQMAEYATHQVGKWDAGMVVPEQIPVNKGFNSNYGYFHHGGDYLTYKTRYCPNLEPPTQLRDFWDTSAPVNLTNLTAETYVEYLYQDRMLETIEDHDSDKPLFLYYAPHLVHTPLEVPKSYYDQFSFIDNEDRRIYAAMVKMLGDIIGEVKSSLRLHGLWNDTLMVMASDNGGPIYAGGGGNNYPLRGGKRSNFQGGIRVNAFASGGYLLLEVRGMTNNGLMALCDLYATFCSLANVSQDDARAELAGLPPVDGLDMSSYLNDCDPEAESPREEVYIGQHIKDGVNQTEGIGSGIIYQNFKYVRGGVLQPFWTGVQFPNNSGRVSPNAPEHDCRSIGCLFDIREDESEYNDLAQTTDMQEILETMRSRWEAMMNTMYLPERGSGADPEPCTVGLEVYGGF